MSKKLTMNLSRTYTFHGRHWGPGETEIVDSGEVKAEDIKKGLVEAEKRNSETEAAPISEVRQPEGPTTVDQGTTPPANPEGNGGEPKTKEEFLALGEEKLREIGMSRGIPGAEAMDTEQLADLLKSE
jgi:hypothetical protein